MVLRGQYNAFRILSFVWFLVGEIYYKLQFYHVCSTHVANAGCLKSSLREKLENAVQNILRFHAINMYNAGLMAEQFD